MDTVSKTTVNITKIYNIDISSYPLISRSLFSNTVSFVECPVGEGLEYPHLSAILRNPAPMHGVGFLKMGNSW